MASVRSGTYCGTYTLVISIIEVVVFHGQYLYLWRHLNMLQLDVDWSLRLETTTHDVMQYNNDVFSTWLKVLIYVHIHNVEHVQLYHLFVTLLCCV